MKQSIVFVVAVVAGLTSSIGYAAGPGAWNVDIFAGKQGSDTLQWDTGQYKTDSGRSQGIAISKQVSPRTTLGFEVGRTKNEYSSARPNYISGTSAMLTAKYDFASYGRLKAYGGVGLGLVRVNYKNHAYGHEHRDTVEGGQVTLGARFAVSPRAGIYLEARHVDTFNDPKVAHNGGVGALKGAEYKGDSLVLGWRYSF